MFDAWPPYAPNGDARPGAVGRSSDASCGRCVGDEFISADMAFGLRDAGVADRGRQSPMPSAWKLDLRITCHNALLYQGIICLLNAVLLKLCFMSASGARHTAE